MKKKVKIDYYREHLINKVGDECFKKSIQYRNCVIGGVLIAILIVWLFIKII